MQRMTAARGLFTAWILSYTSLVYAYTTLSVELRGYDFESLAWAAAIGLGAGLARTILWLAGERAVVIDFWGQLWRDAVFALVGGAFVYILVTYLATVWPEVFVKELRMLCLVVVGASRGRWQNSVGRFVGVALNRAESAITGKPQRQPEPTTITMPLPDK